MTWATRPKVHRLVGNPKASGLRLSNWPSRRNAVGAGGLSVQLTPPASGPTDRRSAVADASGGRIVDDSHLADNFRFTEALSEQVGHPHAPLLQGHKISLDYGWISHTGKYIIALSNVTKFFEIL